MLRSLKVRAVEPLISRLRTISKISTDTPSLYIAQIKDKLGLDKRDNYNHGIGKTARVPQCTPEKEEAIIDAFKHFSLI